MSGLAAVIKVKQITQDGSADLSGIKYIHGIVANTDTLTSASSVLLYDALTATGTPVIEVYANTADATNYEQTYGIILPYPLKLFTGLSSDVTNISSCYIYYS